MKKAREMNLDVFVLTMILYGLACLFSEMIPKVKFGFIELSVEYLLFIPFCISILLSPTAAGLGAATGELVFSEILIGDFGGIKEFNKFARIAFCVWLCGKLVKDIKSRKQVALSSIVSVAVDQFIHFLLNVTMVWLSLDNYKLVPGLPDSIVVIEGIACINDVLFSGILFCMLPTMFLVPMLHGKIEPLLGRAPREIGSEEKLNFSPKMIFIGIAVFVIALACKSITKIAGI